ncbi:MAG: BglG family transcription antiterminator [Oenococcus sp.]|uniref:BglG family transcription antiterminator n=1 Tax=Oenococcus TaxID=46254 RepID=UPI0021E919C8|nr:BglG family transcription antiterminator [Oenococcus kitaharae]MCV3295516.1 BglG family transcription antiterminator [Oenococcus kitaharae]
MNKRDLIVLTELVQHPDLKSAELEKSFDLTRRQLSYSVKNINSQLLNNHLPLISRTSIGTFVIPREVKTFFIDHPQSRTSGYVYHDAEQRRSLIVLLILTSSKILSLAHILNLVNASKTTVANDLKNIRSVLGEKNLVLAYTRQLGYFIRGEELSQRILINQAVSDLLQYLDGRILIARLADLNIERLIHFVHQVESKVGVSYSDDAFNYLVYVSLMHITRNRSQRVSNPKYFFNQIADTCEFQIIRDILDPNWVFDQSDVEWLSIIFLSANTIKGDFSLSDIAILKATQEMIANFEKQTLLEIHDKLDFEKRLLAHLRPAVYRVKYKLHLNEIGISQVMPNDPQHKVLASAIRKSILPLEELTGRPFPDEEIDLIAFYFGGDLVQPSDAVPIKQRAAVVCTNGVIAAKLMFENLISLFPEISFLSATSAREFESFSNDYDLVFTTVPLNTDAKQYIIQPVMSSNSALQLRYQVLNDLGIHDTTITVDKILRLARKYTQILDIEGLETDLKKMFSGQRSLRENIELLPNLSEYIHPNLIQVANEDLTWDQAVRMATQPLIDKDIVTEKYLQVILSNTASTKNYSFLGSQMAIPHTTPENGVLKDAFGFLVLRKPTIFPNGQQISVIAPIAIKNTTKHLRAIEQLAALGTDRQAMTQIVSAKDPQVVTNLIQASIKRGEGK